MSRNGSVLSVGALEIRPDEHQAVAAGHTLTLSVRELELLAALASRKGRIVPRAELYETVWGAPLRADDRSVDVYIHKLRVKLGDALPGWQYIHTHFGFGYRFEPERSHPFTTRPQVRNSLCRSRCDARAARPTPGRNVHDKRSESALPRPRRRACTRRGRVRERQRLVRRRRLVRQRQGGRRFTQRRRGHVPAARLLPFLGGTVAGPNYFIAGLILAIMILPIVAAISREVMATVPVEQKEAALALGATRWEMIRMAVLPYSRAGISGAAMLGLGRAIGETIAATLVIGNAPQIADSLFGQGYTLAAVIANEFGEAAADPTHRAALIAAGLVLFVLTLVINFIARYFVNRSQRAMTRSVPTGMAG